MAQFGIDVQGVKGTIPGDFKLKNLSALRPVILNKGLAIVNQMAPPLFAEVASFSDACPNPERLQKIIEKRNNIVEQANQIAAFLSTILAALTLASTILGTIITVIKVVKLAKGIVQKIAAFIPISPGAIPSGIGIVGDALNDAVTKADGSPRIVPVKESIDGLLIPLGIVIAAIAALVAALSGLDGAITDCVTPAPNPNGGSGGSNGEGGNNPMGDVLRGPLVAVNIEDPGKNYENGTYDDVKLIGGDGNGAKAQIKVQDNKVTKVTIIDGGQGYSKELFDPKKGFQNPNYLTVPNKRLGKIKFNADELLETVDLKKKIVKKLEKQTVVGEGLLLSVKDIAASEDSGGNSTGNLNAGVGENGVDIVDDSNKTGKVTKLKIVKKGGGYDNGIFENVSLIGGSGGGIVASITIESGRLKSAITTKGGDNYKKGDTLTLPKNTANSNLTGIGALIGVESIDATGVNGDQNALGGDGENGKTGEGGELSIGSSGENYIDGNYKNVPLQGGSGEGLTADLTIQGGSIQSARTTNGGNGYKKGDELSLPLDYVKNKLPLSGVTGGGQPILGGGDGVGTLGGGGGIGTGNNLNSLSGQGIGKGSGEGALSTQPNALLSSAQVAEDFTPFSVKSIPQSFTSGEGLGATFDLVFAGENGSATLTEIVVSNPGSGYSSGDVITITNLDLKTAGGVAGGFIGDQGTGDLKLTVTPNSLASFSQALSTPPTPTSPLTLGEDLPILRNITNGTEGTYLGVNLTDEDGGNGGQVDIIIDSNGTILSAKVSQGGNGYIPDGAVSINSSLLGGDSSQTSLLGTITTPSLTPPSLSNTADLGAQAAQSSANNNDLDSSTGNNNTTGQITAGTGGKGVVGKGTGGKVVPIGAGNGTGAIIGITSITPITENSKLVKTNTGLVTSTPLTDTEYASKAEKLLAVLAGGPLLVQGPDGSTIELPGLTVLDPALIQIARGAQEGAQTQNESSYKGFILDIETRVFSPTLTQRRAIAINPSGIVEVTTEFSFATAEDVLIEDLKLIIDELNLRADYSGVDLGEQITSTESEVALPNQQT